MSDSDRPSLLLVDDNAALCETLSHALAGRGFQVTVALSSGEAAALAAEDPPEFAVVELKLPDGPGLKLISTLLRLDPHTRVVVLTAYASIATAIDAIKLGATYYLAKPVDADDIVHAFQRGAGDADTPSNEKPMSLQRVTREHIDRVLRHHNGNVSATARALSMHRRTLQRKLSKPPVRN